MNKDNCIILEERFDDPEQNAARDYVFDQLDKKENNTIIYLELLHFSKKVYRNIKVGMLLNFIINEYIQGGRKPFYPDFEKHTKYLKVSEKSLREYIRSLVKKNILFATNTEKGSLFVLDEEKIQMIITQYKLKIRSSELGC